MMNAHEPLKLSDFVAAAHGIDLAQSAIHGLRSAREDVDALVFALRALFGRIAVGTEFSRDLYELLELSQRSGLAIDQRIEAIEREIERRSA